MTCMRGHAGRYERERGGERRGKSIAQKAGKVKSNKAFWGL